MTWQRGPPEPNPKSLWRLCFLKAGLSQTLSSLQSDQMELDAQGTRRWPLGASHPHPTPPPPPLLTLELALWLHKGTHFLPHACRWWWLFPPPKKKKKKKKKIKNPPSLPSLLQRTVPKCQHVPPGPSQACPYCRGAGVTRSTESTHPWREHNGPRTGWLTGLHTDNTVNRAEWQTASQNNEEPAEQWLENISHHYYMPYPHTHMRTYTHRHSHRCVEKPHARAYTHIFNM